MTVSRLHIICLHWLTWLLCCHHGNRTTTRTELCFNHLERRIIIKSLFVSLMELFGFVFAISEPRHKETHMQRKAGSECYRRRGWCAFINNFSFNNRLNSWRAALIVWLPSSSSSDSDLSKDSQRSYHHLTFFLHGLYLHPKPVFLKRFYRKS